MPMKRIAIRRFPIQAVLVWAAALVVVPMPFTAIPWATLGPMYRSMLTPITAGIYATYGCLNACGSAADPAGSTAS